MKKLNLKEKKDKAKSKIDSERKLPDGRYEIITFVPIMDKQGLIKEMRKVRLVNTEEGAVDDLITLHKLK